MAEKLDGVLLVLFTYLDQRLTAKTSVSAEALMRSARDEHLKGEENVAAGGVGGNSPPNAKRKEQDQLENEPVARLLQVIIRRYI